MSINKINPKHKKFNAKTDNLKAKYDIKKVRDKNGIEEVNGNLRESKPYVTVEANDGHLYIFKYDIDPDSGEMLLSDFDPEQTIAAGSLLRINLIPYLQSCTHQGRL